MATIPIAVDSEANLSNQNSGVQGDEQNEKIKLLHDGVNIYPTVALEDIHFQQKVVDFLEKLGKLGPSAVQLPIFTCSDVELYFIKPNGEVKSTFEKNKLIIYKVCGDSTEIIILKVGDWVYPIFSAISPCYCSEKEIFIFPEILPEVEHAYIGFILPKETSEALQLVLHDLLKNRELVSKNTVSDDLDRVTSYLAENLTTTTTYIANSLDSGTTYIMKATQPKTHVHIDPNLERLTHTVENVTSSAARVTGYLSSNLASVVTAVGSYVSPYFSEKIKGVVSPSTIDFALGICRGIGNIYNGLEQSARILVSSVSNNTVKLVEHRYGPPAGRITDDVLTSVKNIYETDRNVSSWKPRSMAKEVLKNTMSATWEKHQLFHSKCSEGLQDRTAP